jgi:LPS-assembly protein
MSYLCPRPPARLVQIGVFTRAQIGIAPQRTGRQLNTMFRRLIRAALFSGLLVTTAVAALADAGAPAGARLPDLTGRETIYDDASRTLILRGEARLVYGNLVLTADEIEYHRDQNSATARGNFILTNEGRRLVADAGSYDLNTGILRVQNLRVGEFPVYLRGESVEGTLDELVFTNATIFFREDAAYAPSIRAARIVYRRGRIVSGEGLELGFLGGHFVSLPRFQHDLTSELISYFVAKAGYRRRLGLFAEADLRLPVALGVKVGADVGIYSRRGLMAGPALSYRRGGADDLIRGELNSGYIHDSGPRLDDILGRPIGRDRSYLEWWHQQQFSPRLGAQAQLNYWSDSEILRDFHPRRFFPSQQPDSFLEGFYTGENFVLSAFARLHPNRFHRVQERLPEIRFDLLPSAAPAGFYHRLNASFAVVEEDAFLAAPQQRSTRLDGYYGVQRPIAPNSWITVTPVAGVRATHYADAIGGRESYTRTIGEFGVDARARFTGTFDYRNELWGLDGLRHMVEPRISYRYAPQAADGKRFIPAIDRRAFSTYLEPLSIADRRNIDEIDRLDTLRLELHQSLLTRDAEQGSRELAGLTLANDYRFARQPGQRPLSDLHWELSLSPAPWMRVELYQRVTPQTRASQELNYALVLTDQDWWSLRLSSYYLRNDYQEYSVDYRYRLNEVFDLVGHWRYDAERSRFNEQSYGLWQRFGQTWAVKYEVSFFEGRRERDSSFALNVEIELLRF